MKLIEPTMEYDKQIQAYRQEFLDAEGSMDGCGSLRRFDKTQDWIDQVESLKRPETTPENWVPSSQYIYVRESDNKVVGVIQIRHYFNDFLEKYAGHIGYSVCPTERRKGYATQMLRLVLPKCKELGIDRVLISCVRGNEGSRRTILNNGGVYEYTVYEPKEGVYLERYWIDLGDEGMNEVNKTLYIPLYGKSEVSKKHIILHDPTAERIWESEGFVVKGKSKSKWLSYNMAMRARVFDDWTDRMLAEHKDALVLHIGCGLDSRCERVRRLYKRWIDCDLPDVIALRRKYFSESDRYQMMPLDASVPGQIGQLPSADTAVVVLEGLCMYLTNEQLHDFLAALQTKYTYLHVLMDVYTGFGARASKYKNPVNDVGVTKLYGVDDMESLLEGMPLRVKRERTFTPSRLVNELRMPERIIFKMLFTGKVYRKIYRLYELESCYGKQEK